MTVLPHIAGGLLTGGLIVMFHPASASAIMESKALAAAGLGTTLVAAIAADIDTRQSAISSLLPWLYRFIHRRARHRGLTHSLAGLGLAALLYGLVAWLLSPEHTTLLTVLFASPYLSHILLDTFTRSGCEWLAPITSNVYVFPPDDGFRAITGDKRVEIPMTIVFLGLFAWTMDITAQGGAVVSMRNWIGKFEQLRSTYVETANKETVIAFSGYDKRDKSTVSGKALVLAETGSFFVVYFNGRIHYLGEGDSDIRLQKGQIKQLDIAPYTRPGTPGNDPIADILSDIGRDELTSGRLDSDRPFAVRKPYNQRTILVSAKSLEFDYATVADIRALEIQPTDTAKTATAIGARILRTRAVLDSLKDARQQITGRDSLYQRSKLFTAIKEYRQEVKQLEKELRASGHLTEEPLFTGRLEYRRVPDFHATEP